MDIQKGSKLVISHSRKGKINCIATDDFNTETTKWYPVVAAEMVEGRSMDWEEGEKIPCNADFCRKVEIIS